VRFTLVVKLAAVILLRSKVQTQAGTEIWTESTASCEPQKSRNRDQNVTCAGDSRSRAITRFLLHVDPKDLATGTKTQAWKRKKVGDGSR